MTRVLVCGATGFIGRNVVERLAGRGDLEVVAVCNRVPAYDCRGVRWVRHDLTRPDGLDRLLEGVDVVVQAAATTSGVKDIVTRPYIHVTDNAVMNSLLFRAAHDVGVKHVVFFSCTVMYQPSERPVREADFDANRPLVPSYFGVGWTKVYVEKMAEFYARLGRTRYTIVRHSNVYGPHDKYDLERSHVFGATVTKVMTSAGEVVVWGTGEEARDLLHVSDLVAFVELAMARQTEPFTLVNVGLGEAVPVRELVRRMVEASGRPLQIRYDTSRPTIKTTLCLDTTRAKEAFGWQPAVPLDAGIRATLDWYRDHVGVGVA